MSGKKMQTHAHTIRGLAGECGRLCAPVCCWEGKVGEGVFVEKAVTEWFLSLQWKEGLAKGGVKRGCKLLHICGFWWGTEEARVPWYGGGGGNDHAGYTFPMYSRNGSIKERLKYALQHQALFRSSYYDFQTKTGYSSDGLIMHSIVKFIGWLAGLVNFR